jgi:class I fructose-bisphosphate aldolase
LVHDRAAPDVGGCAANAKDEIMKTSDRVRQILSWYSSENPGVLTNLARLMNTGTLAGTGRFVILPVDQGFEHGPARSFAPNPPAYDPDYHFQLAIDAGCNAYAAPLGFLEAGAAKFAGQIPLILKLNNSDTLAKLEPCSAVTGSVKDALRLGASAIGFTIYPGSSARNTMYEEIRELILEGKEAGIPTVIWAYPRGSNLAKEGEQAIDVTAYGAQIACQLGAHIVKVKPPKDVVYQDEAKKVFEKYKVPTATLADRVRHVVQSCFNGKRIVIFSGGEAKDTPSLMEEVRQIAAGGGFGSIMGRNAFQRPHDEAVKLLLDVMAVFKSA